MAKEIEFKGVKRDIGTFSTNPFHSDKRKIVARYDRKNFYPTIFLETKGFPTLKKDPEEKANGRTKFLTVCISAVRREGKRGIFLDSQRDIIYFEELTIFSDELEQVLKKEFNIKELQVKDSVNLKLYPPEKRFKKYVANMVARKEKFRDVDEAKYKEVKNELNTNLGLASTNPNESFDALSLAYLKSISRIEMYKTLEKHYDKVIKSFVDEVDFSERIPEIENDKKHWRRIGY